MGGVQSKRNQNPVSLRLPQRLRDALDAINKDPAGAQRLLRQYMRETDPADAVRGFDELQRVDNLSTAVRKLITTGLMVLSESDDDAGQGEIERSLAADPPCVVYTATSSNRAGLHELVDEVLSRPRCGCDTYYKALLTLVRPGDLYAFVRIPDPEWPGRAPKTVAVLAGTPRTNPIAGTRPVRFDEFRAENEPRYVYFHSMCIHLDYRGRGLFLLMIERVLSHLLVETGNVEPLTLCRVDGLRLFLGYLTEVEERNGGGHDPAGDDDPKTLVALENELLDYALAANPGTTEVPEVHQWRLAPAGRLLLSQLALIPKEEKDKHANAFREPLLRARFELECAGDRAMRIVPMRHVVSARVIRALCHAPERLTTLIARLNGDDSVGESVLGSLTPPSRASLARAVLDLICNVASYMADSVWVAGHKDSLVKPALRAAHYHLNHGAVRDPNTCLPVFTADPSSLGTCVSYRYPSGLERRKSNVLQHRRNALERLERWPTGGRWSRPLS